MAVPVLVTGGAGYIGSHTCKVLAKAGYWPITYDNLVYGHESAVKWGPFVKGDLQDMARLAKVMRKYQPVAVLHFAAYAYVGESVSDPGKYYQNNVAGTISLLNAMKANGCNNIVFSSTCATYGLPMTSPITENNLQKPVNPYGRTKLMIEHILHDFDSAYGLNYVILRYFNAAGADSEGEIGEAHDPETHLIPLVIQTAYGDREYIEIYGTDYATPDGTAIRDYVHVTDLARAHVLALEHMLNGGVSIALNLGTGEGHSVKEVISAVRKATDKPIQVRESDRRAGDPPVLVADSTRAFEVLKWEPEYPQLYTTVQSAVSWYTSSLNNNN